MFRESEIGYGSVGPAVLFAHATIITAAAAAAAVGIAPINISIVSRFLIQAAQELIILQARYLLPRIVPPPQPHRRAGRDGRIIPQGDFVLAHPLLGEGYPSHHARVAVVGVGQFELFVLGVAGPVALTGVVAEAVGRRFGTAHQRAGGAEARFEGDLRAQAREGRVGRGGREADFVDGARTIEEGSAGGGGSRIRVDLGGGTAQEESAGGGGSRVALALGRHPRVLDETRAGGVFVASVEGERAPVDDGGCASDILAAAAGVVAAGDIALILLLMASDGDGLQETGPARE